MSIHDTETVGDKQCVICGNAIPDYYKRQRTTCSQACQAKKNTEWYRRDRGHVTQKDNTKTGALNEMRACASLLQAGCYVFHAVSPHGPCDIIVIFNGTTYRVEVSTSYRRKNGTLAVLRKDAKHVFDVYMLFDQCGHFEYFDHDYKPYQPAWVNPYGAI